MALKLVTFHDRFSTIPPTHHHNHPTTTTPQPPQPHNHHNPVTTTTTTPVHDTCDRSITSQKIQHLHPIAPRHIPHTYSRFLRPLGSIILQKNTAPPLIAPTFHTARAPHLFTILATALDRRRKVQHPPTAPHHRLSTRDRLHLFTILATALERHKNTPSPLSTVGSSSYNIIVCIPLNLPA